MDRPDSDKTFGGSIPKLYETYLVPLLFEPYAVDLAHRLAQKPLSSVLEIAAGTGVVTRRLAATLPESASIVATDLNQAMIDVASTIGTSRPLAWRQADAMNLPFAAGQFDAVVCQFGAMFFPEKSKAFAEARRVLKSGGVFVLTCGIGSKKTNSLMRSAVRSKPRFPRIPRASSAGPRIATVITRGSSGTSPTADSSRRPKSRPSRRAVAQSPHGFRPSPIVRERPCGTRSRHAMHHGSAKQPSWQRS